MAAVMDHIQAARKQAKAKRQQLARTIAWVVIPVVVALWAFSLLGVLRQVMAPDAQPAPVLGERLKSAAARFFERIATGFRAVVTALKDAVRSMRVLETLGVWWRRLMGKPTIPQLEGMTPVILPVISPSPAL